MPVLTLPSGKKIVESGAISRYAAKRAGLYPDDPEKQLQVDEIVELCTSLMVKVPSDKDPEEKAKNRAAYADGFMKKAFNHIDSRLGEAGPFFLGAEFSLADIHFYGLVKMLRNGFFDHIPKEFDATWPRVEVLVAALEANERFAPYKL